MSLTRPIPAPPPATPSAPALPEGDAARRLRVGYLMAAAGALAFSTKAVFVKLAYEEPVDAETLLALRMAMSLPVYLVAGALAVRDFRRRGKPLPPPRLVVRALLVGLLGYWVASYTDFLGLEYITAQFERLILFTYPFFVVLFGALFFGQPITRRVLVAIAVSYVGLAVIFGEKLGSLGTDAVLGGGLVLTAAIAFALYQLLARDVIALMGPWLFTCIAMTGAALAAFLQFLVTHPVGDLAVSNRVLLLAFVIAIGATVLPSFFLSAALHRIPAQANAIIGTLSPVMTIILAVLILKEPLTVPDMVGTALVMAGVGWFTLGAARGR